MSEVEHYMERLAEERALADDLAAVLGDLDLGYADVEVERVLKRYRQARQ